MSSKKVKNLQILFESDDEQGDGGFKTNEKYAKHYNEFRKKEILSHVKNLEEESSSDDDISTDEELVNPEFDEEFFKTMAFLKDKNPGKYVKIPKFFENVATIEPKQHGKSEKLITVADHQRERLLATQGQMSDEEEQEIEHNEDLTYVAEQEKIKSELKKALADSSDSEGEDKLFKVREKTNEEATKEQVDYEKWLKKQDSKSFQPLKDFWTSNQLNKDDQFLRDYILKQKYMRGDGEIQDAIGISDDEAEVEKQTEYEHKYNFRYEEPDNDFIKRFPRNIEDSVRAEDTKRKEKRKEREERKAKEKELKMKELREFQNIRKREIEEKLLLLKDVAGNDNLHEILQEDDLNSDFDPDQHDKRMSKIFDDNYYGIDEGEQKPEFPDIDEELAIENWDNFDKNKSDNNESAQHCEDDDFNMDCDYDPEEEKKRKMQNELIEMSKGRKRKKKVSKLAEIINTEKPAFDPSSSKTYAEYLDEYYKLDYEDIIADQPCRFKYSECIPNDFGLSVEEILMASNKELNQWASLKKTMQNRPRNVELNDVEKYTRMKNNVDLKKKIFKSIYGEQQEESENSDNENESKGNDKKIETDSKVEKNGDKNEGSQVAAPKKKKKKSKKKKTNNTTQVQSSPVPLQKLPEKSAPKAQEKLLPKAQNKPSQKLPEKSEKKATPTTPKVQEKAQQKPSPKPQNKVVNSSQKPKVKELSRALAAFQKLKNLQQKSNESSSQQKSTQNVTNDKQGKKRKLDTSESEKLTAKSSKKPKLDNQKLKNGKSKFGGKNKNFNANSARGENKIGDNRLKAFGINPKKHYNKMKYAGKNQKFNKK